MALSAKLQGVLKNIRDTQGKDVIIDLVNKPKEYPLLCSTQSLGLDDALGGGWAKGRIIEVSGPESSGKTTLSLHAMINLQKQGKVVGFIDAEQSFDNVYFEALGGSLEPDKLIFIQPDSAEQAYNSIEMLAESGEVALIVIDSTNALTPQAELDGEAGDLKVGLAARLLGQHLRKVNRTVKNGVTLFYISQIREKIGIMFGDPRVIGVGNSLKFYASQRVMFSKMETIKVGEESVANKTKAKVIKNKVAPPFKEAIFSIVFGKGVSQDSEIIASCLSKGILFKDGQGVKLGFKTPLWGESAIDTTESKTEILLKSSEFTDLNYEIGLRLDLNLNKITQEDFNILMEPIYKNYEEVNRQFDIYNKESALASGKSLYIKCLYYSILGLSLRPFDKALQTKVKQMEKKLEDKAIKGESIEWNIEILIEQENNLESKLELVDVKELYESYKAEA